MRFAVVHGINETAVVRRNPIDLAISLRQPPASYEVAVVVVLHNADLIREVSQVSNGHVHIAPAVAPYCVKMDGAVWRLAVSECSQEFTVCRELLYGAVVTRDENVAARIDEQPVSCVQLAWV